MEAVAKRTDVEWMTDPLRGLLSTLEDAGFEAFCVGGCVRDAVMGRKANDVDVATNAHPDEVKSLLSTAGMRLFPTGIDHGTWTVKTYGELFEVTTYRRDVATDGRRATVEYAATMAEDAERRDFTMNALYMDKDGNVFDPTGTGYQDALDGRLDFVGDGVQRCKEDYLRILRLFRFHATHGTAPFTLDSIDAVKETREGLNQVSRERVFEEVRKMLSTDDMAQLSYTLLQMRTYNVDTLVFGCEVSWMTPLRIRECEAVTGQKSDWLLRYVMVTRGASLDFPCAKILKRDVDMLNTAEDDPVPGSLEAVACKYGFFVAEQCAIRWKMPVDHEVLDTAANRNPPFTTDDFWKMGYESGPQLGKARAHAAERWLRSGLRFTREQCLANIKDQVPLKA